MIYTDKLGGLESGSDTEKIVKCNYSVNFCEKGRKKQPRFVLLFIETHSQRLYEYSQIFYKCKQFVNFREKGCENKTCFVLLFIETKNNAGKTNFFEIIYGGR